MMSKNPVPMTLWELAKQVSPCRVYAYNRWHDMEPDRLSKTARASVEKEVKRLYPRFVRNIDVWDRPDLMEKELKRRARNLQLRASHLFYIDLPIRVKRELMEGKCEVRARREGNPDVVQLAVSDLASLDVFLDGRVGNASVMYLGVSILPIRKGRGRRKGDGKFDDRPHLKAMKKMYKKSSRHTAISYLREKEAEVEGTSFDAKAQRLEKAYNHWEKQGFPSPDS